MHNNLFGTDGIRGLAGKFPLDQNGAKRIGMAVGAKLAKRGDYIIMGEDPRESSASIAEHITQGLLSQGVNVVRIGVLPTPGLAYLTRDAVYNDNKFVAGVMITASHNPYVYNGVKVFDSQAKKLSDETEEAINSLIMDGVDEKEKGTLYRDDSLKLLYEDFIVGSVKGLRFGGIKIGIDTANGAASGVASKILSRLGANVTAIFDNPDGKNINEACGATNVKALQNLVTNNNLSLGIAFDGDADRVIMVDQLGREVKGDYILYILASVHNLKGVVATVMSNVGFEKALADKGISLTRTSVGDHNVLVGLEQTGYKLGGEESGHIILPDILPTGDGLLAAVQVMDAINSSHKSLSSWFDEVQLIPQALINMEVGNKALLNRPDIKDWIESTTANVKDGRVLIRPSGTEPVVRVMVESENAEVKAEALANELKELINNV